MNKDNFSIVVRYSGERTFQELKRRLHRWSMRTRVETVSSDCFEDTLR